MSEDHRETPSQRNADYLQRATELLWDQQERPTRGPKPGLTRERIVDVALSVADTDGLEGLSMRRVASKLGVGTMSLYRYIPGKAELLDLMLDRISGPSERIEQARALGWRAALETTARQARQLYLDHPWLLRFNWSRPVFGPNSLAGFEQIISTLDGLGLTGRERVNLVVTIDSYVTGAVRQQVMHSSVAEETGITDEEFWSHQHPVLERAMTTGNYPALTGLEEDSFSASWDETFEFGLQHLLDGVAVTLDSRAAHASSG